METTRAEGVGRDEVVRALRELAALMRLRGESGFKVRALETGAARVAQVQGDFGELVRRGRLMEIPGIGPGLAARITELVQTGRLRELDELRRAYPPGLMALTSLPHLGPGKARQLHDELGVTDLESLEAALKEKKVRRLRGFGEATEAKLLEAVQALRRGQVPGEIRLLGEALPRAEQLIAELTSSGTGVRRAEVAGDVRRGAEEVSEVRVVVSADHPAEWLDAVGRLPSVARVVTRGEDRCTVRSFDHDVLIDVRAVRDDAFATALLHATGADAHWERLRARAEARGLTLTDEGLYRGEVRLPTPDERTVYEALGLPWIPPELRQDRGEIEAAEEGTLPELLRLEDVQGIVHSHSIWSDGRDTLEAMARAAKARGFQYLTVTEHSPTASYAGGVKADALPRLWDEIDRLNDRLDGFRILKGVESDILPDGSLDYPDRILEQLDVVIGSVHARHQMDEDEMTRRILRAFDNPHFQILGHATGRLLQRRDPYRIRLDEIFDAAAKRRVVIEINGNPHRLDLNADAARRALRRGVRLVVSTDSHSTQELGHVRYAVLTARRGWARRTDVLNTLPPDEFVASLR